MHMRAASVELKNWPADKRKPCYSYVLVVSTIKWSTTVSLKIKKHLQLMVYPARFFLGSSTPSARPCLFLCRLFLGSSWLPSFGIAEEN